jgi:putative GTP pyrophosphokinase
MSRPAFIQPHIGTASQVNKAARRLAELRVVLLEGESPSKDEWNTVIKDMGLVEGWRELHAPPLRATSANLRHYVRPDSVSSSANVSVTQRLKKFSTILDKLNRHPTMQLSRMEDVGGVRAILPSQQVADRVARRLRKNWTVHRYRDYVREPKHSGYRALHLIVVKKGVKIELQLRTVLQDLWANQVELDSRHLRVDFKSGRGSEAVHAYYVAMSEFLAMREASENPTERFMIDLTDRYRLAQPYLASSRTRSDDGR